RDQSFPLARALTRPGERLDQPAGPRRVRPGPVTAAASVRAPAAPHLLERRPAVGPPAPQEFTRRIGAHEAAIHLQAAPVRVAGVAPAPLVAVDAEPAAPVLRPTREPR